MLLKPGASLGFGLGLGEDNERRYSTPCFSNLIIGKEKDVLFYIDNLVNMNKKSYVDVHNWVAQVVSALPIIRMCLECNLDLKSTDYGSTL